MKLTKVEVRNFRSLFSGDGDSLVFELGDGMNALIGPNNCGKSNVLRAIALALDPGIEFDPERDLPPLGPKVTTRVVCEFEVGSTGPEKTLLKYLCQYEESAGAKRPYADQGILRWTVSRRAGYRQEQFLASGAGARTGDPALLDKAMKQFQKLYRFVLVESGDNLQRLLEGRFREILHTVIQEHLKGHFEAAERKRLGFIEDLENELLRPLGDQILELVAELFPEVSEVSLAPHVPSIEASLSDVDVHLSDSVDSALAQKGTGVRGVVLVAMLKYLADQSQRSLVFAVEEPESFLHPGAQEDLRDDLEALSERSDVTLLMTTHSPFVVSRSPEARLFALAKNQDGATRIGGQADGSEPRASLLGGLFRDAALPDLLERAAELRSSARGFLVVEGWTDQQYLELACERLGRKDFLDQVEIIAAEGATKAAMQALIIRAETARPVLVLLDNDELGKSARRMLTTRFEFQNKKQIISYGDLFDGKAEGIEAEDLFPPQLIERFVSESGEGVLQGKYRRSDGEWHFDLTQEAKGAIPVWLGEKVDHQALDLWGELIDRISGSVGLV